MIKRDEYDRVCKLAGLRPIPGNIPSWITEDKKEGVELNGDKLRSFWIVNNERSYDQTIQSSRIMSVVQAFEEKSVEVEVVQVVPVADKNVLVIGSFSAIAQSYGIPVELANLFFMKFDNQLYIKNPGLLYLASKKGYGHMTVTDKFNEETKEWEAEYKIYPVLTKEIIEAISKLTPSIQEKALITATEPTNGIGRAGSTTIKMKTMLVFARELAQTRAQNRAMRAYTGYGGTSAEELQEGI